MKKSIIFHYSILNMGGAERSIIRLASYLADKGWDVEIVCNSKGGALDSSVDKRVKLSFLRNGQYGVEFKKAKGIFNKLINFGDLIRYVLARTLQVFKEFQYRNKYYDVAVVSLHGLSPRFCCSVVNSRKVLHWIRNDLSVCDKDNKSQSQIRQYQNSTSAYICVSQTAKDSFDSVFPNLSDKSHVVYNILSPEKMIVRYSEPCIIPCFNNGGKTVVSVCRLDDKSKAIFRMLEAHKRLISQGYHFTWYIIGDGPDRNALMKKIDEYGLKTTFVLLGKVDNPFPYYRLCSFVAVTSYYEGLCGVVNEAKISGKAVLATLVSGVNEQLIDRVSGLIVNNDLDSIISGFKELLTSEDLVNQLASEPLNENILNDNFKYEKLVRIINE
ncbi:glycosyltransferase [Vibrio sp. WXL210]|uniref:glycosyltransferase n=1 Tax=Vibrio sp. WXL210 TaxID=3450709 RepID=UPI003EC7128D